MYSAEGFRFVKFGKKKKIYLDKPTSHKVGCQCTNPERWENIFHELTDLEKAVIPNGISVAYYGPCGPCKARQIKKSKERGAAKTAAKVLEQQNREQGEQPTCIQCPAGTNSRFTPKEDGTGYYSLCDYHRERQRSNKKDRWAYLNSLIDQNTQALCQDCAGVFSTEQMVHKWYNVRGEFVAERKVELCPKHWEEKRSRKRKRHDAHIKKLDQEMLDHLASHAADRKGCADDLCPLDRQSLHHELRRRHGDTLGDRLFSRTFDYDHDPRGADRKSVPQIVNDVLRARERNKTKPRCAATCHSFKTWSQFEWKSYFDKGGHQRRPTRKILKKYLNLKLQRFEGRDPHPNHHGKCGCQGYIDDKGEKHECPFQESLEKAKKTFESTRRLGMETEIDSKYGFLTMYVLDHDDRKKKRFFFSQKRGSLASEESHREFVEEMNGATLRCRGCDRFKSIMCGDNVYEIHESACVWVTQKDDMDDLAITIDDEFNNIM